MKRSNSKERRGESIDRPLTAMKPSSRCCELCDGEAALYCPSDSAFLCWSCDRRVHSANFLVSRHLRRLTCSACLSLSDPGLSLTGPGSDPIRPLCRLCGPSRSTSASSCLSTAADSEDRPATARVFEGWGKAMGMRRGKARRCAEMAAGMMKEITIAPLRAAMAAAMWSAVMRVNRDGGEGMLRRLERCSGVPAKVIVFHEARISRAVGDGRRRRRRRREEDCERVEEGWGECSGDL